MKSMCAWCDAPMHDEASGEPGATRTGDVSHGICGSCVGDMFDVPVTDVYAVGADTLECLPFGVLELAADGTIRIYNEVEARMAGLEVGDVLGLNFFTEVAPCTRDTIVQDTFEALLARGGGDADISFVFRFKTGHRLVRIRMLVDTERNRHLLLVQDQDRDQE